MMVNKRILRNFFVNNSISQRQAVIKLIEKKGGDKLYIIHKNKYCKNFI